MNPPRDAPKAPIDWDEVHRQLERNAAAVGEALRPSPERVQAVLDERARALARVPPIPPSPEEVVQVATFLLAGELYAVESCHVRRVVKLGEPTPVPGAPEHLVGVINLHGEILAVFDLRALFEIAPRGLSERSQVIVLGDERDEFGIVADEALEVLTLRIDAIHEPPGSLEGADRQLLRGVTQDALIVLDGAVLLRADRFVINQVEDWGA
jgi:purine-binding chemotaxis protein CheW